MALFRKAVKPKISAQELINTAALMAGDDIGAGPPIPEKIQASLLSQNMSSAPTFAPGQPVQPWLGYGENPRQFNFQTGYNIVTRPRQENGLVPFETLAEMYESYDVAQACSEARISDFRALDWQIVAKPGTKTDVNDQITRGRELVAKPDGSTKYLDWIAQYLRDLFIFDAATAYRMRNLKGECVGLRTISGDTIGVLVDYSGCTPAPPAPAYVQFIQGLPWDWLDANDLIYRPFWKSNQSSYGQPPIERVVMNYNTDLRFQWYWMQTFTENSVPAGFMKAPPDLSSADQILEWQATWDAYLLGDQAKKAQLRWVPAETEYIPTKPAVYDKEFAQFLLHKTCSAFGVTPSRLGFTEDANRAIAETQADADKLNNRPLARHIEELFNGYLQDDRGLKDVVMLVDDGGEEEDKLTIAQAHDIYIRNGTMSIDDVREGELGLPVDVMHPTPRFVETRTGLMPLEGLEASIEAAQAAAAGTGETKAGNDAHGTPGADPEGPRDGQGTMVVRETPNRVAPTDKPIAKALDLWKSSCVERMKKGRPFRRFDDIPSEVADPIWAKLQKARSPEDVKAIFADARPKALTSSATR